MHSLREPHSGTVLTTILVNIRRVQHAMNPQWSLFHRIANVPAMKIRLAPVAVLRPLPPVPKIIEIRLNTPASKTPDNPPCVRDTRRKRPTTTVPTTRRDYSRSTTTRTRCAPWSGGGKSAKRLEYDHDTLRLVWGRKKIRTVPTMRRDWSTTTTRCAWSGGGKTFLAFMETNHIICGVGVPTVPCPEDKHSERVPITVPCPEDKHSERVLRW